MSRFPTGLFSRSLMLGRRSAFWVLLVIGVALTGAFLLDIYVDWIYQGDSLWSTALENLVPILLSLILPYIGWRLFQGSSGSLYLPEAAKYALGGAVGLALLAGLVVGVQVLQGEIKPVLIALQLATGGALAGLCVGYSVAQLKETKREARDDRDRLENLLDGLPVPVVHGLLEGEEVRVLAANAAFEEVFGHAARETVGKNLQDLIRPVDNQGGLAQEGLTQEGLAAVERRAIEEGAAETEFRCMTPEGHREEGQREEGQREFQLQVAQALGSGASETYSVYTDITERKKREQKLREAKVEAEEAARLKSAMLANMSHEIRTPLTSIIGFAEAVGTEAKGLELPEGSPLPKHAELIEKGGKRLLETLEGLLNLSKLEAGQMEISEETVSLATEAERTAEELRPEAEEKQIGLRVQAEDIQVVADKGGVQIVLRNLLSNAIKYTGEGGAVWVRTYRENGRAVLEVEDTGIGMEPSMAEDLFEPFRQASEGWGREYEGTGIGLAVTREAAQQMGGSIEVETEEGEGTRFTVRLPLAEEC